MGQNEYHKQGDSDGEIKQQVRQDGIDDSDSDKNTATETLGTEKYRGSGHTTGVRSTFVTTGIHTMVLIRAIVCTNLQLAKFFSSDLYEEDICVLDLNCRECEHDLPF